MVASVQGQFYNTFFSYDGANYEVRDNACALTEVDVLSVTSFNGYLLAFTVGCHNQLSFNQVAVECSHPYAGGMPRVRTHTRTHTSDIPVEGIVASW